MRHRTQVVVIALAGATLACQTVLAPFAGGLPTPTPTPASASVRPSRTPVIPATPLPAEASPTLAPATPEIGLTLTTPDAGGTSAAFDTPVAGAAGVRQCAYVPGRPVASMPAEVVNAPTPAPHPTATPPSPSLVDDATKARQRRVFRELWQTVKDVYVYPDFRGSDWDGIGDRYRDIVAQGLAPADFYALMQAMLDELGDDHSFFLDPEAAEAEASDQYDYVGIGALVEPLPQTDGAVIISVFPGSPAEQAGLRAHDALLKVDGGPIWDEAGDSRTLGPADTPVTITVQRPGQAAIDLTLTRRQVTGNWPIDYCLVPGTRIGYIFFPTFNDETVDDQTRVALEALTAAGPLDGLILDNRMNGGGSSSVADPIMGFFTSGLQGNFVSRADRDPLRVRPEDVGNSQTVPLVVLVDVDTASYGEIVSGVLRVAGRAQIVGQTTYGNVERLWGYDFEDGSEAWIASETFEPRGAANGIWEETGIIPDVRVPTRWDLFTEANDPALAAAVQLLQGNDK
jgi:C-terminal peptidase prc